MFPDVTDIQPYIYDACVSVAPMRIAAGIQNKVLQSMASHVPVVTTTLGLGGIQAEPGKEILIGDTPEEFAHKVTQLMQDKELRENIAESAFGLIKKRYLWPDIIERMNYALGGLLNK